MHDLWNVTAASAKIPAVSVWIAVIVFAAMVAATCFYGDTRAIYLHSIGIEAQQEDVD